MEGYEVQSNSAETMARECADAAFGKTLASVIMAWWPVTSIIAIILGAIGLKNVNKAEEIATNYGVSAGGKKVAAKIMGKIGLIGGIVMTAFWVTYFFILFIAILTTL